MKSGTQAASILFGAALVLGACESNVATSIYLEVSNAPQAAVPQQVTIEIFGLARDGSPDGTTAGPLLSSSTERVPAPSGELLGTLVIYPNQDFDRLRIRADGLIAGKIVSTDSVDVDVELDRQVSVRLTLGASPGSDGGASGVGGAGGGRGAGGGANGTDAGAPGGAGGSASTSTGAGGATTGTGGSSGAGGATTATGGSSGTGGVTITGAAPRVISVDFVGTGTPMAPAEAAGVVRRAHWNSAARGAGALANLVDADGATTTAAIEWRGPRSANVFAIGLPDTPGDFRMMNGYLDPTNGQTATVSVSGLPSAVTSNGYDVYVYASAFFTPGGDQIRAFNYTIGASTVREVQSTTQRFAGTYVQATGGAGNYVVFRSLRGSAFTLTAFPGFSSNTPLHRAPVNGIQIVGRP